MAYSTLWLNGKLVGGGSYGYTSFRFDLTPHLEFGGENVLAIRLDNPPDSSRWYPGSGIYRNVWLVKKVPVRFTHWGLFASTPTVTKEQTRVNLELTVEPGLQLEPTARGAATLPASSPLPCGTRGTLLCMCALQEWPEGLIIARALVPQLRGRQPIDSSANPRWDPMGESAARAGG